MIVGDLKTEIAESIERFQERIRAELAAESARQLEIAIVEYRRHAHHRMQALVHDRDAAQRRAEDTRDHIAWLEKELARHHRAHRYNLCCSVDGCNEKLSLVIETDGSDRARNLALVYAASSLAWTIGEETGRSVGVTPTAGQTRDLCPEHAEADR